MGEVRGYATNDVFRPHPSKAGLWKMYGSAVLIVLQILTCYSSVGRADDVITLATGEKCVPAPMEDIVLGSPLVQDCVMFGRERNQVGILVGLKHGHELDVSSEEGLESVRNILWCVSSSRIDSSLTMSFEGHTYTKPIRLPRISRGCTRKRSLLRTSL